MQRRGGLFTSPSEQHIGKSDKMRDSAIDRGAVYLVTWAHRAHFNDGDHHSGIRTFLQPAVKVSQQCLFLITISHDKTPPARPAEFGGSRTRVFSKVFEAFASKGHARAFALSCDRSIKHGAAVRSCRRKEPPQHEVTPRRIGCSGSRPSRFSAEGTRQSPGAWFYSSQGARLISRKRAAFRRLIMFESGPLPASSQYRTNQEQRQPPSAVDRRMCSANGARRRNRVARQELPCGLMSSPKSGWRKSSSSSVRAVAATPRVLMPIISDCDPSVLTGSLGNKPGSYLVLTASHRSSRRTQ
jgi:hypothetical protein